MAKKLGIGIIGCGKAGEYHSYWYSRNDQCNLVAFYNRTPKKAELFAGKYGGKQYLEWKDLIEDDEIDVISVCTPVNQHYEQSIYAMNLNKHVLCEKPMALKSKECKKMVGVAIDKDIKLGVFFNMRFHPTIESVNKNIHKIGKIISINMSFQFNRNDLGWRASSDIGTGVLMELGTHAVDLAIQWAGEVERVQAEIGRFKKNTHCEDQVFVICKFKSGSFGCFYNSYNDPSFYDTQVEGLIGQILGKNGKICFLLNSYDPNKNRVFMIKNKIHEEIPIRNVRHIDKVYPGHMDSFGLLINTFIGAVLKKNNNFPSGIDGLKTIEFIEKAFQYKKDDK